MSQVTINLRPSEKDALLLLAYKERRKIQDQAALIIREQLEDRGLIQPDHSEHASQTEREGCNERK